MLQIAHHALTHMPLSCPCCATHRCRCDVLPARRQRALRDWGERHRSELCGPHAHCRVPANAYSASCCIRFFRRLLRVQAFGVSSIPPGGCLLLYEEGVAQAASVPILAWGPGMRTVGGELGMCLFCWGVLNGHAHMCALAATPDEQRLGSRLRARASVGLLVYYHLMPLPTHHFTQACRSPLVLTSACQATTSTWGKPCWGSTTSPTRHAPTRCAPTTAASPSARPKCAGACGFCDNTSRLPVA